MIFVEVWLALAAVCVAGAAYQLIGIVEFHAVLFGLMGLTIFVASNMLFWLWWAFEEIVLK